MHFGGVPGRDGVFLHPVPHQREIQDDGALHPLRVRGGPVQRDEAVHRRGVLQDPQRHAKGAGSRRAGPPGGVSPDPAQGGIQPDRAGKVPDAHSGRDVRVGRAEQDMKKGADL